MKLKMLAIFLLSIIQFGFGSKFFEQDTEKHIFYLHGRIIEIQGKNAYSEAYGKYEFDAIISAIQLKNSVVYSEIRNENVEPREYANKVSGQIDSLISIGVKPIDITVIGASKGAIIASHISSLNINPINYVFMAGNNEFQEANNDWKFHGQVLCIYDSSDEVAGRNYNYWMEKNNFTTKFEQLEVNTNLDHGFIYKPLSVWTEPVRKWILTQDL